MDNSQKPIGFYSFIVCPYAIRVRIVLEELNIPYKYQEIDLLTERHLSDYYRNINPMHKVPALKLNEGQILYESLVCSEYLDKDKVLVPKDRLKHAQIQMWIRYYENNITTKKWKILNFLRSGEVEQVQSLFLRIQKDLKTFLKQSGLLQKIKKNPNQYYMGDRFSMFEIGILPLLIQDIIIFRFLFYKNLLDDELDVNNELKLLEKWVNFASQRQSVQNSIYKIKELPSVTDAPLLQQLDMKEWNFEQYYTQFVLKKFFKDQKPKL